jgi:hypothetical protein
LIGRLDKDLRALDVFVGYVRLRQEAKNLTHLFNIFPPRTWNTLTFFAYMISVALAGKFFISASTITDSAVVSHGEIIVGYSSVSQASRSAQRQASAARVGSKR